jgi:hypothetical protein
MFNTNIYKYNSAEKGLEEALDQVDKLKEDMTNLCDDIDSLYKKQIINDSSTNIKKDYYSFNDDFYSNYKNIKDELMDWNMNEDIYDNNYKKRKKNNSRLSNKNKINNQCITCLNRKNLKKSYSLITSLQSLNKLILQNRKTKIFKNTYYNQKYIKSDKYCCYNCKLRYNFK